MDASLTNLKGTPHHQRAKINHVPQMFRQNKCRMDTMNIVQYIKSQIKKYTVSRRSTAITKYGVVHNLKQPSQMQRTTEVAREQVLYICQTLESILHGAVLFSVFHSTKSAYPEGSINLMDAVGIAKLSCPLLVRVPSRREHLRLSCQNFSTSHKFYCKFPAT